MKKWLKALIALLILAVPLAACSQKPAVKKQAEVIQTPHKGTQFLMGTVVTLSVYNKGKAKAVDDGFARVKALAAKVTVNQKGSQVDAVNQAAGKKPVQVSADVFRLIQYAKRYSQRSEGAFDLAIGPVTSLWHIGFPDARKPSQAEINAVLPLVHYQDVELNAAKRTVYLKKKGMQLDLGGIAKGYIADEVVKVFKKDGVNTAIIDLGGNIFVMGHSPKATNRPWTVGIQDPKKPRGTAIGSVPAVNITVVTSGIYERNLIVAGHNYSHLMNPRTGYPFENNLMGVSIVTKKSVDGDALSTATFDKGLRGGMAFIEKQKDAQAIFITKDKKVYISSGLKNKFQLFKDSGYQMATLK
ncbi:FAD:protein FMN transferase [Lacticaseibacillus jixianensis]|uniref:FAD:protein FMN transferase n=1 Tax=Lacticaseibacillus jixianensis TaxID=2486012 RepID=A0ABW4B926_9LACO|nr:FAD:protein FMN transferase [Lacticaseibacillus jixianensis]